MRLTGRLVLLPLLVTVATAACGSSDPSSGASGGGGSGKVLTVAVVGPMTGDYAVYGTQFVQGVQTAIDQVNGAGGIASGPLKGATLALEKFDDQLDGKQSATIASRIVGDPAVWCVVGFADSGTAEAAGPILDRAGITTFSFGSAPGVTQGRSNVFIDSPPHAAYAFSGAAATKEAGRTHPAVFHIAGAYGDSVHRLFLQGAHARGIQEVFDTGYDGSTTDFKPLLLQARERNPDSINTIGFAGDTGLIVKQAREVGLDVPVVDVGGGGYDPSFLAAAGQAAEGFTGNAPFDPDRRTPAADALRAAFQKTTGSSDLNKVPAAPNQYEAVIAFARAVALGASSPQEVAARVRQVKIDDTGISALSWDAGGTPIGRPMYIYTVRSGRFVFDHGFSYDGSDVQRIGLQR